MIEIERVGSGGLVGGPGIGTQDELTDVARFTGCGRCDIADVGAVKIEEAFRALEDQVIDAIGCLLQGKE